MTPHTDRQPSEGGSLPSRLCPWLMPLFLYAAVVIPATIHQRYAINPDGIIYIRKAQFLLAGHFWDSVSGYWSPAISWCVALVFKVSPQTDPLFAIHGVLAFWGATWLLASCALLCSVLPKQFLWRTLAGMAIALVGARQAVSWIAPDLLLGTMLMAYLACVSRQQLLERRRLAFLSGLLAGLGYLCKSYALPFFALHYPITLGYRALCRRRHVRWESEEDPGKVQWRQLLTPFLIGLVGFAIMAGPWVGIVSRKYGHFTISMVYHHNHMNVAPQAALERLPDFCVVPPDPYLCIWEGLDPGPRKDWSPFSSWKSFAHQIRVVVDHSGRILLETAKFDWTGLSLLAVLAAILPIPRLIKREPFTAVPLWIVLTCGLYSLGFLIVAFETRYIVPIFMPLMIALCLREWKEIFIEPSRDEGATAAPAPGWRNAPWLGATVPVAMTVLFLISGYLGIAPYLFDSPSRPIFVDVAKRLRQAGLVMLFTSSENNRGANLSYYLNQKIVLIPSREDIGTIQKELAAAGVNEVLVWTDTRSDSATSYPNRLAAMLMHTKAWRPGMKTMKLDSVRRLDVYVRRTPLAQPLLSKTESHVNGRVPATSSNK